MSTAPEIVQSCSHCGATIYAEHFQRGLAIRQSGQLFCHHCLEERTKAAAGPRGIDVAGLGLDDHAAPPDALGGSTLHGHSGSGQEGMYRKPMFKSAAAATRMRTFHAKLSEGAIVHLDQQVNSWLDTHPDLEIKFATTTVGTWEGKHPEPNIILSIFY